MIDLIKAVINTYIQCLKIIIHPDGNLKDRLIYSLFPIVVTLVGVMGGVLGYWIVLEVLGV
jgi:hypothetical protein